MADEIQKKQKLDVVGDKKFQTLKSKWMFIQGYLEENPLSEAEQADFVNDILNAPEVVSPIKPVNDRSGGSWGLGRLVSSGLEAIRGLGSGSAPQSSLGSSRAARELKDPEFVARLHPLEKTFPVLSNLTRQLYERLNRNLEDIEKKILQDQVTRVLSNERHRQLKAASDVRDLAFRDGNQRAFESLMEILRRDMASTSK